MIRCNKIIFPGCWLAVILFSCNRPAPLREEIYPVTELANNFEYPNTRQKKQGDAAEGKQYTHVDTGNAFSAGIVWPIPDSLLNHDIRVIVSGYIRKGQRDGSHALVVSVQNTDTTIFWDIFEADNIIYRNDEWRKFTDSLQVPAFTNKVKGMELRLFGWSPRMLSYLDLDDLKVTIKKVDVFTPE